LPSRTRAAHQATPGVIERGDQLIGLLGDGPGAAHQAVGEVRELTNPLRRDLVGLATRVLQITAGPLLRVLADADGRPLGGLDHGLDPRSDRAGLGVGNALTGSGTLAAGIVVASSPDHSAPVRITMSHSGISGYRRRADAPQGGFHAASRQRCGG
jgi:hypothetical protein